MARDVARRKQLHGTTSVIKQSDTFRHLISSTPTYIPPTCPPTYRPRGCGPTLRHSRSCILRGGIDSSAAGLMQDCLGARKVRAGLSRSWGSQPQVSGPSETSHENILNEERFGWLCVWCLDNSIDPGRRSVGRRLGYRGWPFDRGPGETSIQLRKLGRCEIGSDFMVKCGRYLSPHSFYSLLLCSY